MDGPTEVGAAGRRYLVVEDDEAIAKLVERVLTKGEDQAKAVPTAERALDELDSGSWDALVADIWLPGMTGLELTSRVRQTRPGLPILVMTAQVAEGIDEEARRCGADDFLPKPFTPSVLRSRIAQLVGKPRD